YLLPLFSLFLFSCSGDLRDLHSFPTRRSSDLCQRGYGFVSRFQQPSLQRRCHLKRFLLLIADGTKKVVDQFAGVGADASELVNEDRKSTRLNSSHVEISYAVFCLKKKKKQKDK